MTCCTSSLRCDCDTQLALGVIYSSTASHPTHSRTTSLQGSDLPPSLEPLPSSGERDLAASAPRYTPLISRTPLCYSPSQPSTSQHATGRPSDQHQGVARPARPAPLLGAGGFDGVTRVGTPLPLPQWCRLVPSEAAEARRRGCGRRRRWRGRLLRRCEFTELHPDTVRV